MFAAQCKHLCFSAYKINRPMFQGSLSVQRQVHFMMCEHDSPCTGPGLGEKEAEPLCKADDPLAACFIRLSNRQTQCKGEDISSYTPRRQMHGGGVSCCVGEKSLDVLGCQDAQRHPPQLHAYSLSIRAPPKQPPPPALVVRSPSKGPFTAKKWIPQEVSPERGEGRAVCNRLAARAASCQHCPACTGTQAGRAAVP